MSCRGVDRMSCRGVERESIRGVRDESLGVDIPSLRGVVEVSRTLRLCRTQSSAAFCQSDGSVYTGIWTTGLCRGTAGVRKSGCLGVVAKGVMYGVCAEGV